MAIAPFLRDAAFDPGEIRNMSTALEDVCRALKVDTDTKTREVIAIRIIELARRGERSPTKLSERVVIEANGGTTAEA